MHAKGDKIVAEAKKLVGIKYRHQGRSGIGLDCVGVPIYIAHKLGLFTFDTKAYSPRPNPDEFTQHMIASGCQQIPLKDLANGDLIRIAYKGWPVHLAVYEKDERGQEWIIHAFARHKQVSRDALTKETRKLISSIWRLPDPENDKLKVIEKPEIDNPELVEKLAARERARKTRELRLKKK